MGLFALGQGHLVLGLFVVHYGANEQTELGLSHHRNRWGEVPSRIPHIGQMISVRVLFPGSTSSGITNY